MQLLRLSSPPVILSVLVLLLNHSIFTNASPISLFPRDDVICAENYASCQSEAGATYCCPPSTTCAANNGCAGVIPTIESPTPTSDSTSTPTSTTSSSAANPPKNDRPFFTTKVIIAVSTGGGIALLLTIAVFWACHRKRQQGKALLAAYESPDREPYEVISLKTKKSTPSFNGAAPPAPTVPTIAQPGTSTSTTFNIPQHTATPPPDYRNGSGSQAADEKEFFPRYPPQTFQEQDSPSTPTGSQRGPFPAELLRSPRVSSLPPYSPTRSGFASQQGTRSPRQVSLQQVPGTSRHTSFSQQQIPHATFYQQATFSPTQTRYSQQTALSQTRPTGFSFTPQGGATPVASPPASPMTPSHADQEMFLPAGSHPENQELFLPIDNPRQTNQELFRVIDDRQSQSPQPQYGYPMAY